MRLLLSDYPGLLVCDLAKGEAPLPHLVWVDPVACEYARHVATRDGTIVIDAVSGDWQTEVVKVGRGRLRLDWTRCSVEPPA